MKSSSPRNGDGISAAARTNLVSSDRTLLHELAELASQICDAPLALIVSRNDDRGWVELESNLPLSESLRDLAFIACGTLGREPLQIADMDSDARFASGSLPITDPIIQFYAGVPLLATDGRGIGVLCVMDTVSRQLSERQMDGLRKLGSQVVALIEARSVVSVENEVQESQEDLLVWATRYRRLFESARDGILILDHTTGKITDANPFALEMLGYSRQELLGLQLFEIGHPQDESKSKAAFGELLEKGFVRYEDLPLQTKSGQLREVEFVANVYLESDKKVVQCNVRDITERKQNAAIDKEFQNFLQSALDEMASQIVVPQAAGNSAEVNLDWQNLLEKNEDDKRAETDAQSNDAKSNDAQGNDAKSNHAAGPDATRQSDAAVRANGIWSKEANMVVQGIREVMAQRRQNLTQEDPGHNLIEQRWFNVFLTYFLDAELMRIVVARQDVTERELAEKQIRFQARLLDTVGEAVIAIDLQGKITYWNQFAEKLYGWSASDSMGRDISTLVIPRGERRRAFSVMTELRAGQDWSGEFTVRHRSGTQFLVAATNTPIYNGAELVGIISISQDISERKRAEAMLRESEERFRLLVESVQDYAIFMLDTQGHIASWNSGAQHLKGYRADEIIGRHFSCFYLPEDIAARQPEIELEIATRTGRFEGEGLRVGKGGKQFWANILITAVRDEKGVLRGFSKVTHDITERKQAKEALEKTNREILNIWESMTDAFVAVDTNWRLTHVNEHAALIWKKEREKILGQNLWDIFPAAVNLSFYQEYHRAVRDQIAVVFEEFYPPLKIWLEVHAYPSPVGLSIYFRDVSQRKAAEQAIRNSEARFQNIVANAPGMVYQFVLYPDGSVEIPFVNDGCRRLFSLAPVEIQSNASFFEEIVHPADFAEWQRTVSESARNLSPWDWEGRIKLSSGQVKWVQGAARPKRMPQGGTLWDGLLMEITDRKQAEEERDRFFTLSLDMLCISDYNGYFKRLNPAFEATLGYPLNDMLAKPFLDLIHPEDREATLMELDKLARGETTLQFVNRYKCANGSYKWLSWQAVPYEDLTYAVAHDVTPLKEAESKLRRVNDELELRVARRTEQLARSNEELRVENIERQMTMAALRQVTEAFRLAKEEADAANQAKSEFLSRMSHELRTPLNAILGFGQILEMRSLEPEDHEGLSQILKAGWHLLDLVNEILDIARVEAGHLEMALEAIAVADVVPECCSLLQPLADQGEIRVDENGSILSDYYLRADRQRLRQILINLLSNAIKYNSAGGEVHVSCFPTSGERIRIAIRDTGPGLSAQDMEKLFIPFERLHAANSKIEGSGLGLALSQRLLTAMGGKLGVESQVGQGCTFWIDLPRAEALDAALAQATDSSPHEALGSKLLGSKLLGSKLREEIGNANFSSSSAERDEVAQRNTNAALFEKYLNHRQEIQMPAVTAPATGATSTSPPASPYLAPVSVASVPLHILVVEDNQVNQQVIVHQLNKLGHESVVLDNGIAAVEAWQRTPFDLVLMDCNMPQMNGYAAAREIRRLESEGEHIPIIALTANAMSGDREKCLAAGMDDYLSKPTKQSDLAEVIGRWSPEPIVSGEAPTEVSGTVQKTRDDKLTTLQAERWKELQEEIDPDLLEDLVRLFLQETPPQIETLRESLKEENAHNVAQNAHKIKGSCGTMGADRMAASCREIEKLAEIGNLADCVPIMERLPGEFDAVQIALQNALASVTGFKNI